MREKKLKFWGPLFLIATLVAAATGCKDKTPAEVFEEVLAKELVRADKVFAGAKLPEVPFAEEYTQKSLVFRFLITPDFIYFDNTRWLSALPMELRQNLAQRTVLDLDDETPIFSGRIRTTSISGDEGWWYDNKIGQIMEVARIREQLTGQDWSDSHTELYFSSETSFLFLNNMNRAFGVMQFPNKEIIVLSNGKASLLNIAVVGRGARMMGGEWPMGVKDRCGEKGKKCCIEPNLKLTKEGLFADYRYVRLFDPEAKAGAHQESSPAEHNWKYVRRLTRNNYNEPAARRTESSLNMSEFSDVVSFFKEMDHPKCPHVNMSTEPDTKWRYLSTVISNTRKMLNTKKIYLFFNGPADEKEMSTSHYAENPIFEEIEFKDDSIETDFRVMRVGFAGVTLPPDWSAL